MKLKIQDLADFKKGLVEHLLKEWKLRAEQLEQEWAQKILAASPTPEPYSNDSKRERTEQQARIAMSDAKSPINELKNVAQKPILPQTDNKVGPFTLFDVTTTELAKDIVTTYFLIPIQSLPMNNMKTTWNGISISLLDQGSRFNGLSLNWSEEIKGGEIWEEPAMGRIISTGRFTNDVTTKITAVYSDLSFKA